MVYRRRNTFRKRNNKKNTLKIGGRNGELFEQGKTYILQSNEPFKNTTPFEKNFYKVERILRTGLSRFGEKKILFQFLGNDITNPRYTQSYPMELDDFIATMIVEHLSIMAVFDKGNPFSEAKLSEITSKPLDRQQATAITTPDQQAITISKQAVKKSSDKFDALLQNRNPLPPPTELI